MKNKDIESKEKRPDNEQKGQNEKKSRGKAAKNKTPNEIYVKGKQMK
jgi:hypothetical protein